MTNQTPTVAKGGIGFIGALFLVFLTLKLCDVIAWSWVWVAAPLWIPVAFLAVLVLLAVVCGGLS
jgi:hypothetical protein